MQTEPKSDLETFRQKELTSYGGEGLHQERGGQNQREPLFRVQEWLKKRLRG